MSWWCSYGLGDVQGYHGLENCPSSWVVARPCALLLAAPIFLMQQHFHKHHRGGMARGGDVLESLAKVNLALLDKTGTLTTGHPRFGELTLGKNQKKRYGAEISRSRSRKIQQPSLCKTHYRKLSISITKTHQCNESY